MLGEPFAEGDEPSEPVVENYAYFTSELADPDFDFAGLYDAFKTHVAEHPEVALEELLQGINVRCSRFADEFEAPEARAHIDWAIGKPEGFGGR